MTIYERVVSVFTSERCAYCNHHGTSVCGGCIESIAGTRQSRCGLCNTLTLDWRVCSNCRRGCPLATLAIASNYETELKDTLQRFKFQRQRHLAQPLALLLEPLVVEQFDVVTHVPTAGQHRRQRGYDQAELLAVELALLLDIPQQSLIMRVRGERQVGHSRKQRQRLARQQFALGIGVDEVAGKRILIVDDVVTTGATLSAVASVLKSAQPKLLAAVAVAKS